MTESKYLISANDVIGQMAMWAARQHPFHKPPRLDDVTQQIIDASNDPSWDEASLRSFRCKYFASSREIEQWLESIFPDDHEIMVIWNSRANGNTAPFGFASRYDTSQPEDDFIDIGALLRNVATGCIRERDREDHPTTSHIQAESR